MRTMPLDLMNPLLQRTAFGLLAFAALWTTRPPRLPLTQDVDLGLNEVRDLVLGLERRAAGMATELASLPADARREHALENEDLARHARALRAPLVDLLEEEALLEATVARKALARAVADLLATSTDLALEPDQDSVGRLRQELGRLLALRKLCTPHQAHCLEEAQAATEAWLTQCVRAAERRRAAEAAPEPSAALAARLAPWIEGLGVDAERHLQREQALAQERAAALAAAHARTRVTGWAAALFALAGLGLLELRGRRDARLAKSLCARAERPSSAPIDAPPGELAQSLQRLFKGFGTLADGTQERAACIAQAIGRVGREARGAQQQAAQRQARMAELRTALADSSSTTARDAQALEARELTRATRSETLRGRDSTHLLSESMAQVSGSMAHVAESLATLDEIALQTDMLALNASVEAARVGAAGRGFSVVAGEVRGLATRATRVAHEISERMTLATGDARRAEQQTLEMRSLFEQLVRRVDALEPLLEQLSEGRSSSTPAAASAALCSLARETDEEDQRLERILDEARAARDVLLELMRDLEPLAPRAFSLLERMRTRTTGAGPEA